MKRGMWTAVVAIVAFVGAAAGFVGNMGGARDAVCRLAAAEPYCVRWGLIAPGEDPAAVRRELLSRVVGEWGNVASEGVNACTTRVNYALSERDGEHYVTLTMTGSDYESVGRVASAENGSVFTRTVSPAAQAGTQWELRLEADRLIQVDNAGTPTPLVRCEG